MAPRADLSQCGKTAENEGDTPLTDHFDPKGTFRAPPSPRRRKKVTKHIEFEDNNRRESVMDVASETTRETLNHHFEAITKDAPECRIDYTRASLDLVSWERACRWAAEARKSLELRGEPIPEPRLPEICRYRPWVNMV